MSKKNVSTTIRQPDRQPYEVIETLEETVTRYFNPTSLDTKIPQTNEMQETDSNCKWSEQRNPSECNSNPKITFKDIQFQDLYERFKKLWSIMSEIRESFQEISKRAQYNNNVSVSRNVADSQNWLNFDNKSDISELANDEEQQSPELEMTMLFPKKSITKFSEDSKIGLDQNLQIEDQQTPKYSYSVQDNERKDRFDGNSLYSHKDESLLKKSKQLLTNLINKEIQKSDQRKRERVPMSNTCVRCKIGCIQNICRDLNVLKNLECFEA